MADLVGGRLDVMFTPVVEAIEQVRSGQVRALGITRAARSAQLPEIPAVAEALPGYRVQLLARPVSALAARRPRWWRGWGARSRRPCGCLRCGRGWRSPVTSWWAARRRNSPASSAAELPCVAELARLSGATVERSGHRRMLPCLPAMLPLTNRAVHATPRESKGGAGACRRSFCTTSSSSPPRRRPWRPMGWLDRHHRRHQGGNRRRLVVHDSRLCGSIVRETAKRSALHPSTGEKVAVQGCRDRALQGQPGTEGRGAGLA